MLALPARAQFGASVAVQSDQRLRGVSISAEKPQAQLSLGYDAEAGWYGGAMLARAQIGGATSPFVQAYLGRVMALRPGLDIEAGATHSRFTKLRRYDYSEAYVGLLGERWNARLHVSPHYFGRGQRSVYAELNAHWPLADSLQAMAHLGALNVGAEAYRRNPHGRTRLDGRAGLTLRHGLAEFQLAWVGADRGGPYPPPYEQRPATLVLGAAFAF